MQGVRTSSARNASKLRGRFPQNRSWRPPAGVAFASVVRRHATRSQPAQLGPQVVPTPPRGGKERDGVIAGESCVTRSRDGTPRVSVSAGNPRCPFPFLPTARPAHQAITDSPCASPALALKSSTKASQGPAITPPDKHQRTHHQFPALRRLGPRRQRECRRIGVGSQTLVSLFIKRNRSRDGGGVAVLLGSKLN